MSKSIRFKLVFLLIIVATFPSIQGYSQRCDKKKFCPSELLGEYDYGPQTTYTQLGTGDTIRIKTVVYSKFNYRIFVCGERRLGDIRFKVYYPEKRFEPTIDRIIDKQVVDYKRDKNGFLIYDNNEEPIKQGISVVKDTVWTRRLVTYDNLVFDNDVPENLFWESEVKKTRLMIVEIVIPKSRRYFFGCIAVMVGRIPFIEQKDTVAIN